MVGIALSGTTLPWWRSVLNESLRTTAVVHLENFWLSEWMPLRPGLYHTNKARERRKDAQHHVIAGPGGREAYRRDFESLLGRPVDPALLDRFGAPYSHVFDPYGKKALVDGGFGCVRLRQHRMGGGLTWFMGASSTPVAHEGMPVALSERHYSEVVHRVADEGKGWPITSLAG